MNSFIKLLYSLLIAIATVTFVGVSIFSFYQPPEPPDYEYTSRTYIDSGQPGYVAQQAEIEKEEEERSKQREAYRDKERDYNRNVTFITLPLTALLLAAGVVALKRADVVGEGISLGGIATAIYTIIVASMADHRILRFLAVTLLLVGALVIAHRRFAGDNDKKKK